MEAEKAHDEGRRRRGYQRPQVNSGQWLAGMGPELRGKRRRVEASGTAREIKKGRVGLARPFGDLVFLLVAARAGLRPAPTASSL